MTHDDRNDPPPFPFLLSSTFGTGPHARRVVISHLTRMAEGRDPYQNFSDMPLINRALWLAAADIIKTMDKNERDAS